jgi:hypothetical protein
VRTGSGGVGSAFTAQYTTRHKYTIGIFKTTIMKTNSQTSTRESVRNGAPARIARAARPCRLSSATVGAESSYAASVSVTNSSFKRT